MKTITTVLPVYDKIAKQCFERGKDGGVDSPVTIKCPKHRLPSMLWNVESDDPGEIASIELIGGAESYIEPIFNDWINHGGWDTFTHSGLDITSAINNAGSEIADIALNGAYEVPVNAGDVITVRGTLAYAGASPHLIFRENDGDMQNSTMTNGAYTVTYTASINCDLSIGMTYGIGSFSFLDVEVGITDVEDYFSTSAAYIQDGGGAGWTNSGYDTFTSVLRDITSAIKTTAAGEASCLNAISVGSVPPGVAVGETIRIKAVLTLNSGTAPKIALRRTDINVAISNIVTLAAGTNYVMLTVTEAMAGTWGIVIYNSDTELSNWSCLLTLGEKSVIPKLFTSLTDDYFQYSGETLGQMLPCGPYYLKITTENGIIYYSDYFTVEEIYSNLITSLVNVDYDTFTVVDNAITSAINAAGTAISTSNLFDLTFGENVTIMFFLTKNGGQLPTCYITNEVGTLNDSQACSIGLNVIQLTAAWSGNSYFKFYNSSASNFETSEVVVIRGYSEKYLTINFSNTCDLGDILYQDGFSQTMWLKTEPMEMTFPQEEKGVENGEGRFVRTFARQVKKYTVRTPDLPAYMAEVFHRMKLHDTVELTDLVGDINDVYNLEVEHEWLWDDKYYCKADLTFDFNEVFVIGGCCNNLT